LDLLNWTQLVTGLATCTPRDWKPLEKAFREVISTSHRERLSMNALERLLILLHGSLPMWEQRIDDRIAAAIEHIHTHLGDRLSVDVLSCLVHLSPSRFSHLFREGIGMPPSEYVDLQRMSRAKHLLDRTTLSVKEIGTAVGLEPFHLSTRFRAHTGLSPRAYRNRALLAKQSDTVAAVLGQAPPLNAKLVPLATSLSGEQMGTS
jgi:transcriptional regulator GlxA family with amidase domain